MPVRLSIAIKRLEAIPSGAKPRNVIRHRVVCASPVAVSGCLGDGLCTQVVH
jgi:hypothetical protein